MTPEDIERLEELEELIEMGEELDEEDREELHNLRHERRSEKRRGKLSKQFLAAKRVWRFPDDDDTADGFVYTLTREDMLATLTDPAVDQGLIEEVDRPVRAEKLVFDEYQMVFWFLPEGEQDHG